MFRFKGHIFHLVHSKEVDLIACLMLNWSEIAGLLCKRPYDRKSKVNVLWEAKLANIFVFF